MPHEPGRPGGVEAVAGAVAGSAFALSMLLARRATFLPPGLFDALAVLLAALGLAPLLHRLAGPFAATCLRGAGISAALWLTARSLLPPFDQAAPLVALAGAGGTLLQAHGRLAKPRFPIAGAGLVLLGLSVLLAFVRAEAFPEPERLRFALLVASFVFLALLALRLVLLRRARSLTPRPAGLLVGALLGAVYLAYRSLVAGQVSNLPLYEWSLAVMLATLGLTRLRRVARKDESAEAWSSDARRHAQDVTPLYDERMGPAAAVVRRYLDTGEGFDAYRALWAASAEESAPLAEALARAQAVPSSRGRGARREAARARLEAHRALLAFLSRGP